MGESGCGKTTIGKALLNIYRPTQGKIEYHFKKEKLLLNKEKYLKRNSVLQKNVQMILQDPFSALNPRLNIYQILAEPLKNKAFKFSKKDISQKIDNISTGGVEGYIQQLYGIEKSYELMENYEKKNNINFDIILRSRSDVIYKNPLYIKNYDLNSIVLPKFHYWDGINDRFALGNTYNMNYYMKLHL